MPALSVKVYYKNEIRRFTVDIGDDDNRFGFQRLMNKLYHFFPNLVDGNLRVMWQDKDGDFVLMSSNPELKEAVANLPEENKVLRVHLFQEESGLQKPQEQPEEHLLMDDSQQHEKAQEQQQQDQQEQGRTKGNVMDDDPNLHHNVVCDGCQGDVRGIRYKCLTCPDYDLCSGCIDHIGHDEHPMLRITSPKDESWMGAFFSSQSVAVVPGLFHGGRCFGFGGCRRRCHYHGAGGCRAHEHDEAQEQDQTKEEQPKKEKGEEPDFFTEQMVRNLTGAMETVLSAVGIPVPDRAFAGPTQETAAASVSDENGNDAKASGHPNAKIAAALNYMLAMGYRNDGGWLTKLLEEKGGDVSAVLDILLPNPGH